MMNTDTQRRPLFLGQLVLLCLLTALAGGARAQGTPDGEARPQLVTQIGHTNGVLSVAFSPDAKVLASGSRDSTIKLWDVATGMLLRTLQGHALGVTALAFSPDGSQLASGAADAGLLVWDVATGRRLQTLPRHRYALWERTFGENAVTQVAYLSDGTGLISQYDDHAVELWGLPGAKHLTTLIPPESAGELSQSAVGFMMGVPAAKDIGQPRKPRIRITPRTAPGNAAIQTNSSLQAVRRMLRRYTDGPLFTTTLGPDGRHLAVCRRGQKFMFLDLEADKTVGEFQGAITAQAPLALSPHADRAVTEAGHGLKVFDLATGKPVAGPLSEPLTRSNQVERGSKGESAFAAAFSPDSAFLAVSGGKTSDKTVRLWDAVTGTLARTLRGPADSINQVAFSPDGRLLAGAGDDKTVTLWDTATGSRVRVLDGQAQPIHAVTFSPEGARLAIGGSELNAIYDVGNERGEETHVWSLTESRPLQTLAGLKGDVLALTFSPDGVLLAGSSRSNLLQVWNTATGGPGRALKGTNSLAFHSTGRTLDSDLVSTGEDTSRAVRWDVASGHPLKTFHLDTGTNGDLVAYSPDGTLVACGNPSGGVSLYSVATGKKQRAIPVFPTYDTRDDADTYLSALTFSPDSKTVATDGPGASVKLWDVSTGHLRRTLTGHTSNVTCLAFSLDGGTLADGSRDSSILLWDVATGRRLQRLTGHDGPVRGLAFRADGKLLASGSDDATTRLWSVASGLELCRLISFPGGGWVVVTPEGRFDTNGLDNVQSLHWVLPDAPFTPLPLELFLRQYYEPRLLTRLLSGEKLPDIPSIAALNRVQPQVHVTGVRPHPDDPSIVDVTVEAKGDTGTFHQNGTDVVKQSGVYDLRLFRNGQLVGSLPTGEEGEKPTDLTNATNGTVAQTFTVRLPRDGSEAAEFSAYAFNVDQVKSQTVRQRYTLPRPLPPAKGRAYVITLGVNAYQDPHWDLHDAAQDARLILDTLPGELGKTGQYVEVVTIPLLADYKETTTGREVTEAGATRSNLHAVLDILAGKPVAADVRTALPNGDRLHTAAPEDLVVLAFACHGDADDRGNFYLFPYDIGPKQEQGLTEDLKAHAVSSRDLSLWLRDVDAGTMTMIVDACHSAATVNVPGFKPGPMGSRGLGQLAYDKGMQILAASQSDNVALESHLLGGGHGLLTWALVHDGLDAGQADANPKDGMITLSKWLKYGVARVPVLYAQVKAGKVQSFGRDLPRATEAVTGSGQAAPPPVQQPALFDFNKQRHEVLLLSGK